MTLSITRHVDRGFAAVAVSSGEYLLVEVNVNGADASVALVLNDRSFEFYRDRSELRVEILPDDIPLGEGTLTFSALFNSARAIRFKVALVGPEGARIRLVKDIAVQSTDGSDQFVDALHIHANGSTDTGPLRP